MNHIRDYSKKTTDVPVQQRQQSVLINTAEKAVAVAVMSDLTRS